MFSNREFTTPTSAVMDEWVDILGHGGQGEAQGLNCCCLETVLIVTITITLNTHFVAAVSTRRH